jgi:hypothetical protein
MSRISVWLCVTAVVVSALPTAAQQAANAGYTNESTASATSDPGASVSGSGTTDFIPIWTNGTTLGNSALFQLGTGAKAKVGIGTSKPASTLDVKGGGTIRGLFSLPTTGTATTSTGFNSQPIDLAASVFNSSASEPVTQTFQWQAEPVGNDTATATGSLNLLFGQGSTKPTETGFHIDSNGQLTFATGQTFPGAGTVTSVGSGAGLTGGPITTSGTLAIDTTVVPQLGAGTNTFTGNITAGGTVKAAAGNFSGSIGGGTITTTGAGSFGSIVETGNISSFGQGTFGNLDVPNAGNTNAANLENNSNNATLQLINNIAPADGNFMAAFFNGDGKDVFDVDTKGDTFAAGSKSAVVPLRNGEMVALFSMESPEVWFEDFGSGRLSGGATIITLDPKFIQTVNLSLGYHVFLTPKGDCKGLFVTGENNSGFEVRELGGGKSSVEFDYRIVAHRNGYETKRLPVAILPVAAKLNRASAVINKKK